MKIVLPFLGKTKERYIEYGINDFSGRLSRYVSVEIQHIREKPAKGLSVEQQKSADCTLLDTNLSPGTYRIALDRRGQSMSSRELSTLITDLENRGMKTVSFIIGGPPGLTDFFLKKADLVISLSKMTFTHDLTRMLLLEQLYRAYTIKAGTPYHK